MNDQDGPAEINAEERRVLDLVDRLASPGSHDDPPPGGTGEHELVEALCRLPWALPQAPVAPAVREAILTRARSEAGPAPAAAAAARQRGWMLPLAAVLALALAGLSGWQYLRLESQSRALGRLDRSLASAQGIERELDALRTELAGYRERLEMLTTPGAEFCVLRPAGREPVYPAAHATMVLAADRKSWYLRAAGLEPCAAGRAYKIWFHTGGGPIPGPAFRVDDAGAPVEVTDGDAPEGIRAISITLEAQPAAARPEGPEILFADEAMLLL